jgi:putative PIN family toxin of toxin-antitoxin system
VEGTVGIGVPPMRVFVDANTLVSGLIFQGNESQILELGEVGVIELLITTEIFEEVGDAISRNEFNHGEDEIKNLMGYLQRTVQILRKPDYNSVKEVSQLLDDKEDAHVWAGLAYADADFLLTGDKELLRKVDRAIRTKDILKKLEDLMEGE